MWLQIGLCVVAILLFVFRKRKLHVPVVDPNYPIIGSATVLAQSIDQLPSYILEGTLQFRKTWGVELPAIGLLSRGAVIPVRVEEIEYILEKNFDNYEKGWQVNSCLEEVLGDGIFASDGVTWLWHRKVAVHMFTRRLMQNSAQVMQNRTNILIQKLREFSQQKGKVFDMQDLFFRLTIDVFVEIAFGIDLKSLEREKQHEFAYAFDRVQVLIEKRFVKTFWTAERLFGSAEEKEISKCVKTINEFAETVITSRRRAAEDGNLGPDLLSRFLEDSSQPLSNKQLRDVVMNFVIAGRDTTAITLSWLLHELLLHPTWLSRVRAELSAAKTLSSSSATTPPESSSASSATTTPRGDANQLSADRLASSSVLPLTHAVISETLRKHPAVPKQIKFAKERDVWPDGSVIDPGTAVLYSSYVLGHNPDVWEDPEIFNPNRFLDTTDPTNPKPAKEPSAFKFLAFNAGKRICLGKGLAYMEIKTVLMELLPRFDFVAPQPNTGEFRAGLVMPMRDGLWLAANEVKPSA